MFKRCISVTLLSLILGANAQAKTTYSPIDKDMLTNYGNLVHFGIIGDYGNNSNDEEKVAKALDKHEPEFIVTLGDNNYSRGCWDTIDKNIGQFYSKYIGNYKGKYGKGSDVNRFFPSTGNHDWNAIDSCRYQGGLPYLAYFTLPNNGLYYDYVKGPVHFFAVDSDGRTPDGNKKGSTQYAWLKKKLKESTSCFNVVYFHHAPYTSGEHGNSKELQWEFEKLGADVVLAGHDHHYERIMRDGIVYFVNGSGGARIRKLDGKAVEGSKRQFDKRNGFMMGYAHENRLAFAFFDEDDRIKDSLMLTKDSCSK